jgi:hypothetical protein
MQCTSVFITVCQKVVNYIRPIVTSWGVKIINFQLESTKLADAKYAQEYEEASLKMAKAKANTRALQFENEILLQKARASADGKCWRECNCEEYLNGKRTSDPKQATVSVGASAIAKCIQSYQTMKYCV